MNNVDRRNDHSNEIFEIIHILRAEARPKARMIDVNSTQTLAEILADQLQRNGFRTYVSVRSEPMIRGRKIGTTYWIIVNCHIVVWVNNRRLQTLSEKFLALTSMAGGFFKFDRIDIAMLVNFGETIHGSGKARIMKMLKQFEQCLEEEDRTPLRGLCISLISASSSIGLSRLMETPSVSQRSLPPISVNTDNTCSWQKNTRPTP